MNFEAIPEQLKQRHQWVCWRAVPKDNGKVDKIPVNPSTGMNASHANSKTWGTFQQALARHQNDGGLAGIGYVFSKDCPCCGIDLDHCRDLKTGSIEPWAWDEIQSLNSYTEISPSGTGVHIIVKAALPGGGHKNKQIEIYDQLRFFTMTGKILDGSPNEPRAAQGAIDRLLDTHFKKDLPEVIRQSAGIPLNIDDGELLNKGRSAKNGDQFDLLYSGKWEQAGYGSQSEADQALCNKLAFWCGRDGEHINRLFRQSGLMRPKWDKKHHSDGSTYGQKTIQNAIANTTDVYKPSAANMPAIPFTDEIVETLTVKPGNGKNEKVERVERGVKGQQWSNLHDAVLTAEDFTSLDIPEKQQLLTPWLHENSITLISGSRGLGKTWFSLGIVQAITTGGGFGPWRAENPCPCLYLDGEMAAVDVQERLRILKPDAERKQPLHVYSDAFATAQGIKRAHLACPEWRFDMQLLLEELGVKLWIVDNVASLSPGLDENAKQDWDEVNQWLLHLRFGGIATIMIHHTGKSGDQRGTSAREDNIDISIRLVRPQGYRQDEGSRFVVKFSKARIPHEDLPAISDREFQLRPGLNDCMVWTHRKVAKTNKVQVLKLLDAGMSQIDIAKKVGIARGTVSKIRSEAIDLGYLTKKNKITFNGWTLQNAE